MTHPRPSVSQKCEHLPKTSGNSKILNNLINMALSLKYDYNIEVGDFNFATIHGRTGHSKQDSKDQETIQSVSQLTQDTTWESNKNTININKSQEVSPLPARQIV